MASDGVAARVAEIRARHAEYPPPEWSEVAILLAALAAAETARDQARADAVDAMMAHGLAVEALRHVEAECKRDLAAADARATRLTTTLALIAEGGITGSYIVQEARAALDAPPAEGA